MIKKITATVELDSDAITPVELASLLGNLFKETPTDQKPESSDQAPKTADKKDNTQKLTIPVNNINISGGSESQKIFLEIQGSDLKISVR